MPFIAQHVRLANSGKIPELFLTAKTVTSPNLADSNLGKLYYVIQINLPWSHSSSIGASLINAVSREYYRQTGSSPLESFEKAIAKSNQLVEQLSRDGDTRLPNAIHALIGLVVGDDFHLAVCGEAEAYFRRDDKLNLITDPGRSEIENNQIFPSLVSGELSVNDTILLGSPSLYGALTVEELNLILKDQLNESTMNLARRLKSLKSKKVNAIIINIKTVQSAENELVNHHQETIYLDQPLDSTWTLIKYYCKIIAIPVYIFFKLLVEQVTKFGRLGLKFIGKNTPAIVNKLKLHSPKFSPSGSVKLIKFINLDKISTLTSKFKQLRPMIKDSSVPVNHYTARRTSKSLSRLFSLANGPIKILNDLGKQLRLALRRSPRTWYFISALILLSSIGASIQTRQLNTKLKPVATTATIEQMKSLIEEAKQAKVYGQADKARSLYLQAIAKGNEAITNPKLLGTATPLLTNSQKELYSLAGATELVSLTPLIKLDSNVTHGAVHEGVLYTVTVGGVIQANQLAGSESTRLANLPDGQSANQFVLIPDLKQIIIQTYTGDIFHYDLNKEQLKPYSAPTKSFPVSSGLGFYNNALYLLDPAANQIWKYPLEGQSYAQPVAYLKNKKNDLTNIHSLSIDGSLFVLDKKGEVTKFVRGTNSEFKVSKIPSPFDQLNNPIGFFVDTAADNYYLADLGNETIGPRIIELNSLGQFSHQYLMPTKWRGKVKLVLANPRTHKAWALVENEVYELTLIR